MGAALWREVRLTSVQAQGSRSCGGGVHGARAGGAGAPGNEAVKRWINKLPLALTPLGGGGGRGLFRIVHAGGR
jgi:hypothetical protein